MKAFLQNGQSAPPDGGGGDSAARGPRVCHLRRQAEPGGGGRAADAQREHGMADLDQAYKSPTSKEGTSDNINCCPVDQSTREKERGPHHKEPSVMSHDSS